MPLNGLRWSRNSGSANCDMPQSAVFGQPGGGVWLRILSIKDFRKDEFVLWLFGAFVVWFICMIKLNFLNLWIIVRTKQQKNKLMQKNHFQHLGSA